MPFGPIRGERRVSCRDSRTRLDWAEEIRSLLEGDYPLAEEVSLVCDDPNTHHIASPHEAFAAEQAHRLEIHFTPNDGSWLDGAEVEPSVPSRQCPDRRIASEEELEAALAAWQPGRNESGSRVRWRSTTADARIRLAHLYPQH